MEFKLSSFTGRSCLLLFIILGVAACSEVVEENLDNDRVVLLNPGDNYSTTYTTQTFTWQEVEGADRYRMQIVNGTFQSINYFVLDTNLVSTQFVFNLNPGDYQWRIKATNSVSETPYSVRTINIDSTTDLTGQTVLLSFPDNNLVLNDTNPSYSWQGLYNADHYIFQLRRTNSNGPLVYSDTVIATDLTNASSLQEGKYSWGVKAINSTSSTGFNYRNFTIDLTPPTAPGIETTDSTQQGSILLEWNQTSNDVEVDSFYLYTNANLTNIIRNIETDDESFTDSIPQGTYYWRVKSIDFAGNIGPFSKANKIRVTQ